MVAELKLTVPQTSSLLENCTYIHFNPFSLIKFVNVEKEFSIIRIEEVKLLSSELAECTSHIALWSIQKLIRVVRLIGV